MEIQQRATGLHRAYTKAIYFSVNVREKHKNKEDRIYLMTELISDLTATPKKFFFLPQQHHRHCCR